MTEMEAQLVLNGLERVEKNQDRLMEGQASIIERMDHLDECVDGAKDAIKALHQTMQSIVPDGDFEGHRQYHLTMMRRWNWIDKLKHSVLTKVVEWAAVGALGWLLITLWGGVKISLSQ